jgi:hypothetical protein
MFKLNTSQRSGRVTRNKLRGCSACLCYCSVDIFQPLEETKDKVTSTQSDFVEV